jgi:hypothetical protein
MRALRESGLAEPVAEFYRRIEMGVVNEAQGPPTNPVVQLLQGLMDKADSLFIDHKGRIRAFSDPELEVSAGLRFIRGQLRGLEEKVKAAKAAATE